MKLADVPADVRAALDIERYMPHGRPPRHPANGELWFDDGCAVCGASAELGTDRDHCHVTGLYRGLLCRGCNVAEGNHRGDHWPFWRLHAPGLANREVQAGERSPYLTDIEVMTLSLAELFALDERRSDCAMWAAAGIVLDMDMYRSSTEVAS